MREYSGFGKWKPIVSNLLKDDPSLTKEFYSLSDENNRKIIGKYEADFEKAFMKTLKKIKNNYSVIYPTKYTIRTNDGIDTHAILIIGHNNHVHVFDPNGAYHEKTIHFGDSDKFRTSTQMLSSLKKLARENGMRVKVTGSKHGMQRYLKDYDRSVFIRNAGYCMFICRKVLQYILKHISTEPNIIKLAKKAEYIQFAKNYGPTSFKLIRSIWPRPSFV